MKTLIVATGILLALALNPANAQTGRPPGAGNNDKPRIFSDLPARVRVRPQLIDSIFSLSVGTKVNSWLGEGLRFVGEVVTRSKEGLPYTTVVLKSNSHHGAALSLTRSTNAAGKTVLRGRYLSFKSADAFEFVQTEGQWFFQKRDLSELVTE